MRRRVGVALALCGLLFAAPASGAERAANDLPRAASAGAAARTEPVAAQSTGDWGWWVVAPSLSAGASLLAYGLSIDCSKADTACQRKASLAIWGSVGIASLGSLLGISIVQAGQAPQAPRSGQKPKTRGARELRLGLAPVLASGSSGSGAMVQLTATLN